MGCAFFCECPDFFNDWPVLPQTCKKLKYFFYIYPDGSDLTKTTIEMTTTITTTTTTGTAQTAATARRWRWSGETEEPDYSRWIGDNDEGNYTQDEKDYAEWYDACPDCECFDDDTPSVLPVAVAAAQQHVHTHVPFMNLTKEERDRKSNQFKFGLCVHCDAGLDDESDFVCEPRGLGCSWVMACNACHEYYRQLAYLRVVDDNGGCN